jgi:hypothetical protein
MPRVACLMMLKDEGELLRTWIEYHGRLFGRHNLFIYDNASTDPHTLAILRKYGDYGYSINRQFSDPNAHLRKGHIFGGMISALEATGHFDFFLPIDCDEFFVLREGNGITTLPAAIHAELDSLREQEQVLFLDTAFYNMLGRPEHYFKWSHRKNFFRSGTFGTMDAGFHEAQARTASGRHDTRFAHMHYHHKPYAVLVEHCKNKLRPAINPDDEAQLHDPRNKNRLTDLITQGEDAYMAKFRHQTGVHLPEFAHYIRSLGVNLPF